MKTLRIVLGVLNLLACSVVLIIVFAILSGGWDFSARFTLVWGSPLFIATAFVLVCGIFTLLGKSWWWTVSGLVVAAAALMYPLILTLCVF